LGPGYIAVEDKVFLFHIIRVKMIPSGESAVIYAVFPYFDPQKELRGRERRNTMLSR
jgi:hypothetical protein